MLGKIILGGLVLFAGDVYLLNARWLAAPTEGGQPRLIAHRGVYQTFSRDSVEAETCTAARIDTPSHEFMENTLTPDKVFAVLHDWTIDCRTEGHGVTEETPWTTLKTLDIGYGYTADGGKGAGLMPRLEDGYVWTNTVETIGPLLKGN